MTDWRTELARLTAAGVTVRYPWAAWFDAGSVSLERGLDYHCDTARLQRTAWMAASRAQLRIRSKTTESGVTLTFWPRVEAVQEQAAEEHAA